MTGHRLSSDYTIRAFRVTLRSNSIWRTQVKPANSGAKFVSGPGVSDACVTCRFRLQPLRLKPPGRTHVVISTNEPPPPPPPGAGAGLLTSSARLPSAGARAAGHSAVANCRHATAGLVPGRVGAPIERDWAASPPIPTESGGSVGMGEGWQRASGSGWRLQNANSTTPPVTMR